MMMFLAAAAATFGGLPDAARPDVECLMVYTAAAGLAKTDEDRLPALMGTAYFYGRIESAYPSVDVTDVLKDASTAIDEMEKAKLTAIGDTCDKRFQAMGQRFSKASEALK